MYSTRWIFWINSPPLWAHFYCWICRLCLIYTLMMLWWTSIYMNLCLIHWDKFLDLLLPVQTKVGNSQILEVWLLLYKLYGLFFSSLPHVLFPLPVLVKEKISGSSCGSDPSGTRSVMLRRKLSSLFSVSDTDRLQQTASTCSEITRRTGSSSRHICQ